MNKENFNIEKVRGNSKAFKKRLGKRLKEYTEAKGGPFRQKEIAFVVTTKNGKWVGGLFGLTYWNALFIDLLWVEGKYRGRGLGLQLMDQAENEARQRGCAFAHVNSHSLQAPGFYRKLGYKVFGKLTGFPKGQMAYSFCKKL